MEINLLLTILIIAIWLGSALLQADHSSSVVSQQMVVSIHIQNDLESSLLQGAGRLVIRISNMLNIVANHNASKGAQSAPVYTEFHPIWG